MLQVAYYAVVALAHFIDSTNSNYSANKVVGNLVSMGGSYHSEVLSSYCFVVAIYLEVSNYFEDANFDLVAITDFLAIVDYPPMVVMLLLG